MNAAARRHDRLKTEAEAFFGQTVRDITAPGGVSRASLRLHFDDKTVIGSLRPNFRRTHLEAHILQRLQPFCDDIPVCYGVVGDIMFQSDVGERRLNREIVTLAPTDQVALAEEAVAAIFRIQAAARQTNLHQTLPHLGNSRDWIESFIAGVEILEPVMGKPLSKGFDRTAIAELLDHSGRQFVKWDCRSGNAALDGSGRLRWFDFEYAGLRHGAEDFAWLIGDESWPLDGETMFDIVEDGYDPACGHERYDYMSYLTVYTVLHSIQRLKLILQEVQAHGWRAKDEIRDRDDVGKDPDFAAHLCNVAAFFADQHPLTFLLTPYLEASEARFRQIAQAGR